MQSRCPDLINIDSTTDHTTPAIVGYHSLSITGVDSYSCPVSVAVKVPFAVSPSRIKCVFGSSDNIVLLAFPSNLRRNSSVRPAIRCLSSALFIAHLGVSFLFSILTHGFVRSEAQNEFHTL